MRKKALLEFLYNWFPEEIGQNFQKLFYALIILGIILGLLLAIAAADRQKAIFALLATPMFFIVLFFLITWVTYLSYKGKILEIYYQPQEKTILVKRWKKDDLKAQIKEAKFILKEKEAKYRGYFFELKIKTPKGQATSFPIFKDKNQIKKIYEELQLIKENPNSFKSEKYYDLKKMK